jgi:hypothetical protein
MSAWKSAPGCEDAAWNIEGYAATPAVAGGGGLDVVGDQPLLASLEVAIEGAHCARD